MKKNLILLSLVFLTFSGILFGHQYEIGFRIRNANGSPVSGISVKVLSLDPSTNTVEVLGEAVSDNTTLMQSRDVNAGFDRYTSIKQGGFIASDEPNYPDVALRRTYYLLIDNRLFVKYEFRESLDFDEPYGDFAVEHVVGSNSITEIVNNSSWYMSSGTQLWKEFAVSLTSTKSNIKIQVDGSKFSLPLSGKQYNYEVITFPHSFKVFPEEETNCTWRNWRINSNTVIPSETFSLLTDHCPTIYANNVTAKYGNHLGVNLTTNMSNSTVHINNVAYSCPTSSAFFYDDDDNTIAAYEQEIDNFICVINYWKLNGSYYGNKISFTLPPANTANSLQAVFKKTKLSNIGEGLYFGTNQNAPITLYWTCNPKATKYKIWRHVRVNGNWQADINIATVGYGVSTYVDQDYLLNA
ncbi:MAG: hypothetical protein FD143_1425 [Ignavibacteria bacterium]|nr:MAG: hypothetical protein FD143_1425 [Ignavibacteria bacterium]KAF0160476.1 MAG: hypothetical protein FD188_1650 [Ignavibacteria bacterium]